MTPYEWTTTAIAVLGLVGGAFGFFYGRSARAKAGESQLLAVQAQQESAVALKRSAAADERVVEVWERLAAPPEPTVDFEVGSTADRTMGWIKNIGDLEARSLTISGYPEPVKNLASIRTPIDLPPGQTIQFTISERLSLPVKQVEVAWTDDRSEELQSKRYWI